MCIYIHRLHLYVCIWPLSLPHSLSLTLSPSLSLAHAFSFSLSLSVYLYPENTVLERSFLTGIDRVEFGAGVFPAIISERKQLNEHTQNHRQMLRGTWYFQRSDGTLQVFWILFWIFKMFGGVFDCRKPSSGGRKLPSEGGEFLRSNCCFHNVWIFFTEFWMDGMPHSLCKFLSNTQKKEYDSTRYRHPVRDMV